MPTPPPITSFMATRASGTGAVTSVSLRRFAGAARPRRIIEIARQNGAAVLGMRAVQAGALTRAIDRDVAPDNPDARDYLRAAPFRAWCEKWGEDRRSSSSRRHRDGWCR